MTELVMSLKSRFNFVEFWNKVVGFWKQRQLYNQTYRELSSLTDHELADLGFHRSQIKRIALEAYYDNQVR